MKKKPAAQVKASVSFGTSYVYSNVGPIVCWLCGVTVPAHTEHSCERKA